ncbi:MAG: threonine/serine dehydratase [Gemmatimonadota bacterium]
MSSRIVGTADIAEAARALAGVAVRTPLLPADWLSELLGADVRLKCENLQRAGAFKLRGAYTAISRLPADVRARGVITYSSGNHAQGVALAAKLFGIRAVVVMPTTAPAVKVDGARRLGAEVVLEGTTSTERQRRAESIAAEQSLAIVPAFDHPDIIAGQGTVGLEILEDFPEVDVIVAPVGGGGLLAGIAAYVRQTAPHVRIIGVEPRAADAMRQSLDAGEPVTIPAGATVADGLMPVRPGDLTFEHTRDLVDEVVRVDDAAIVEATRRLMSDSKLVVEFSGAATVAALLSGVCGVAAGSRVVAVLSGGNIDPARALRLMDAAAAAAAPAAAAALATPAPLA